MGLAGCGRTQRRGVCATLGAPRSGPAFRAAGGWGVSTAIGTVGFGIFRPVEGNAVSDFPVASFGVTPGPVWCLDVRVVLAFLPVAAGLGEGDGVGTLPRCCFARVFPGPPLAVSGHRCGGGDGLGGLGATAAVLGRTTLLVGRFVDFITSEEGPPEGEPGSPKFGLPDRAVQRF